MSRVADIPGATRIPTRERYGSCERGITYHMNYVLKPKPVFRVGDQRLCTQCTREVMQLVHTP